MTGGRPPMSQAASEEALRAVTIGELAVLVESIIARPLATDTGTPRPLDGLPRSSQAPRTGPAAGRPR